jgi:integrase
MATKKPTIADLTALHTNPLAIRPDGTIEFDPSKPDEKAFALDWLKDNPPKPAPAPTLTDDERMEHARAQARLEYSLQLEKEQRAREDAERRAQLAQPDSMAADPWRYSPLPAVVYAEPPKPKGPLFSTKADEYRHIFKGTIKDRTMKAYKSKVDYFMEWAGPSLTVGEITKEKWRAFQAYLGKGDPATGRAGIVPRSIDEYTNAVGVVLKWALDGSHPLQGMILVSKKQKAKPKGRSFTPEELKRIFAPERLNAIRHPADVWLILLSLFTGARPNELCQLTLADVRTVNGVQVLDIQDDTEGNSLKNEPSRRLVPIHPTVIDLGFLDYCADVRAMPDATNQTRLFPWLNHYEQGFADEPSQRFTKLLKNMGIHQFRVKTLYSFRHTLNGKFREKGISIEWRKMFVGHENDEINSTTYGDATPVERLAQIVLPALDWGLPWHEVRINRQGVKDALVHLMKHADKREAKKARLAKHIEARTELLQRNPNLGQPADPTAPTATTTKERATP